MHSLISRLPARTARSLSGSAGAGAPYRITPR